MLLLSHLFFSILLLLAWFGSLDDNPFLSLSILALSLPLLFFINILFTLFWTFYTHSKINMLISVFPIIFCLFIANRFFTIRSRGNRGSLSVISYNIKKFTPYRNTYQKEELHLFAKKYNTIIQEQDPDILCLQEYSFERSNLKNIYPYFVFDFHLEEKKSRPLAIFSKFPIIRQYSVKVKGRYTNNLFADIVFKKDTIRVVNIHLESLTLRKNDLKQPDRDFIAKYKKLYQRLLNSFKLHRYQIDTILKEIKKSPYPVILCGDFNNTPFSYEYSQTVKYLSDAYQEKGSGIVDTYHNIPIPIRIDYIFASPSIKINRYQVIRQKISDHYPVKIECTIPAKKGSIIKN